MPAIWKNQKGLDSELLLYNGPSMYKLVLLFNDARKMVIRSLAKFMFILRQTYG